MRIIGMAMLLAHNRGALAKVEVSKIACVPNLLNRGNVVEHAHLNN